MGLHLAAGLKRWVESAEAKTRHAGRLNIGPRLILGFGFIILSMLAVDAVVLWQFHVVRTQVERLSDIDQKQIAVLRVHASLLAFHDRLNTLADSEDAARLMTEAGPLRSAVLEDIRRAMSALGPRPVDLQRDPTILPILHVIQRTLPSQLEAITTLATSGDWRPVHLRLANQIRPLESLTSTLVEKVDNEVGKEQAQTALNFRRVQWRVFLIVPLTAVLTLLIAATLAVAITRSITQPLEQLVEGSKALARGEFQHQVGISGEDELAHLGHVFNDAARRLRDLYGTLQSREDRLRRVIDTIPAHAWSTLPDGAVEFINQRFLEFAGRSRGDLLGWGWGSVVHPDDLGRYVDQWKAAVAAGEPMEGQARVRRADGDYRMLLIRNVPLRDDLGKIVNWYGTAIDIEERYRAEEALRQAQADLARVSRVTAMGELTASLAHEVKQPITAAVTNANTCVRWLARDAPDIAEARAAAMRIVDDGRRAADIISRIRLVFTKGAPQREWVDVNDLIQEMTVLLHGEATRYAISVRTALAPELPQVMGDRVQLQQVLMNLIMNGIDAMKAVEWTRDLTITSQRADNEHVLVSVTDTGVGLPRQQVDQIFKAFFTTKDHGIGMGLSISRSIVESHGGRLWAADHEPRGASFYLSLPTGGERLE
jgi:PAS domain S-box-containing protein